MGNFDTSSQEVQLVGPVYQSSKAPGLPMKSSSEVLDPKLKSHLSQQFFLQ